MAIQAFSIYSADDGSLIFYKRDIEALPVVGEQFEGKTVSAIYTGFETNTYTSSSKVPWVSIRNEITNITFADEISPISTKYWFSGCSNITSIDMANLDTTNITYMGHMFSGCTALKTIYVSNTWNTNNVTNSDNMFYNCSSLKGRIPYNSNYTDKTYANGRLGYFINNNLEEDTIPTAILYNDGSFVFQLGHTLDQSHGNAIGAHTGFDTIISASKTDLSWDADRLKILNVSFKDKISPTSTAYWFASCTKMISFDGTNLDTSNVTTMERMFDTCSSLTSVDLSGFDASNVTSMKYLFYNCKNLKSANLSNLNAGNVTSIASMFSTCSSLTSVDLSGFDASNVTTMADMFYNCSALTDINFSGWNTSSLTSMEDVFYECKSLKVLDLTGFRAEKLTNMDRTFNNCSALETVYVSNKWYADPNKIFNSSSNTFSGCNLIVGGCGKTYNYSHRDSSYANVYDGYFTQKVSEDDEPAAFAIYSADDGSLNFYKRVVIPFVGSTFEGKTVTKVCMGFEVAEYTSSSKPAPWKSMNSNITNITFVDEIVPVSTAYWFYDSKAAVINNINNLNTSNVTNMCMMFYSCDYLTELDLSSWDTSNVTDMSSMFEYCPALKTIYVSDLWDVSSVTLSTKMFYNCNNLVGQSGKTYSSSHTDKTYANYETGYFTYKEYIASVPPAFSGQTITYTYTVSGADGETIHVDESFNGAVFNSFDTISGSEHTLVLNISDLKLPNI